MLALLRHAFQKYHFVAAGQVSPVSKMVDG